MALGAAGLKEPPAGTPQFRRDNVESPPRFTTDYMEAVFGTSALPLRDAVESVPQRFLLR